MNVVANRAKTFGKWKFVSPTAEQLADAGFVRLLNTKDCLLRYLPVQVGHGRQCLEGSRVRVPIL